MGDGRWIKIFEDIAFGVSVDALHCCFPCAALRLLHASAGNSLRGRGLRGI